MIHTFQDTKKEPKPLSDPRIIGPGIWITIHIKARQAKTDAKKKEFIDYMWFLADNFPCMNCRKHINEYIRTHPFEHLYNLKNDEGVDIGMFKWSWMFHNAVNTRLRKPYMDWKTAWEMYSMYDEDSDVKPCTEDCGEEGHDNKIDPNTDKIIQGYFINKGISENMSKFS